MFRKQCGKGTAQRTYQQICRTFAST